MLNDLLINVIGSLIGSILYIIITKNNKEKRNGRIKFIKYYPTSG